MTWKAKVHVLDRIEDQDYKAEILKRRFYTVFVLVDLPLAKHDTCKDSRMVLTKTY